MTAWTDCTTCGPHEIAPKGDTGRVCYCPCHADPDNEGEQDG